MVVSGLMVLSVGERAPQEYHRVNRTYDDGVQVFKRKQLFVRIQPQEEAKEAVTEILLVRAHNKEEVENGFKHLPYVMKPSQLGAVAL